MNTRNVLIGGFIAAIVYFLLGWLFYGNLLVDFFHRNAGNAKDVMGQVERGKDQMILWMIFIGNLASGLLIAFVMDRGKGFSFGSGLWAGAVVGLLSGAGYDLVRYATSNMMNKNAVLADVLVFAVMSAIAGAVAGAVLSKTGKRSMA
jgi:uncharacterized membrane protein